MPTATAQGKRFSFPEGTTPEQMGQAIDEYFSGQQTPTEHQELISGRGIYGQQTTDKTPVLKYGSDTALEAMAAVNRGAVGLLDLPGSLANAVLDLSGSDKRVPAIAELPGIKEGVQGEFMQPGLMRDIVRAGGELAAPAPPILQAGKQISKGIMVADDVARIPQVTKDLLPQLDIITKVPGTKSSKEVVALAEKGGLSQQFVKNARSPEMAEFVVRNGEVVTDPIAKQAIKQGIDKGLVSMIKTASKETRDRMRAQLEILKRGKGDLRFADKYRPWDVAGRSMTDRIEFLKSVNREGGKEVNAAAKALQGKMVDYSPAVDNFIGDLNDLGVTIVRGSDGKIVPDFTKSVFRSSPKPKKIVRDIIARLDTDNPVDAREVHIAKKYIDELVNWGKSATGNAGQVESVAKRLRGGLNETLGNAFPAYREANQKYSETLNALEDIAQSSGVKLNVFDSGFDQAVGTGLRRLLSNAQSKSTLSKAADDVESLSRKYGAEFGDDVRDQVSFANQLDAIFGASAKTSLAGEVGKEVERVADVALGQKTIPGMAAEAVSSFYKKARGVNEDNAIKALETLLSSEY